MPFEATSKEDSGRVTKRLVLLMSSLEKDKKKRASGHSLFLLG